MAVSKTPAIDNISFLKSRLIAIARTSDTITIDKMKLGKENSNINPTP